MSGEPFDPGRRDPDVSVASTLDDELVRALYAEHAGPLLGYVLRLTGGDRHRAEDVVQETMLRAWRHPEAAKPAHGSLRPWLITVARNIVIDHARARKARPAEVGEPSAAMVAVRRRPGGDRACAGRRRGDRDVEPDAPGGPARDVLPRQERGGGGRSTASTTRHREVAHVLRVAGAQTGIRGEGGDAMTHDEARIAIGALALGALDEAEAAEVRAHMATCPDCQREYDELRGIPALLGLVSAGEVIAGPPVASAVRQRPAAGGRSWPSGKPRSAAVGQPVCRRARARRRGCRDRFRGRRGRRRPKSSPQTSRWPPPTRPPASGRRSRSTTSAGGPRSSSSSAASRSGRPAGSSRCPDRRSGVGQHLDRARQRPRIHHHPRRGRLASRRDRSLRRHRRQTVISWSSISLESETAPASE